MLTGRNNSRHRFLEKQWRESLPSLTLLSPSYPTYSGSSVSGASVIDHVALPIPRCAMERIGFKISTCCEEAVVASPSLSDHMPIKLWRCNPKRNSPPPLSGFLVKRDEWCDKAKTFFCERMRGASSYSAKILAIESSCRDAAATLARPRRIAKDDPELNLYFVRSLQRLMCCGHVFEAKRLAASAPHWRISISSVSVWGDMDALVLFWSSRVAEKRSRDEIPTSVGSRLREAEKKRRWSCLLSAWKSRVFCPPLCCLASLNGPLESPEEIISELCEIGALMLRRRRP